MTTITKEPPFETRMPRVVAISSPEVTAERLLEVQRQGFLVFIYHHADPSHSLIADKFAYIHSDEELVEKMALLRLDRSVQMRVQQW